MNGQTEWEPAQLRNFRAGLQAKPPLYERALALLGDDPPPDGERVLIRTDRQSVDLALVRALALAVDGVTCRMELIADEPRFL